MKLYLYSAEEKDSKLKILYPVKYSFKIKSRDVFKKVKSENSFSTDIYYKK